MLLENLKHSPSKTFKKPNQKTPKKSVELYYGLNHGFNHWFKLRCIFIQLCTQVPKVRVPMGRKFNVRAKMHFMHIKRIRFLKDYFVSPSKFLRRWNDTEGEEKPSTTPPFSKHPHCSAVPVSKVASFGLLAILFWWGHFNPIVMASSPALMRTSPTRTTAHSKKTTDAP